MKDKTKSMHGMMPGMHPNSEAVSQFKIPTKRSPYRAL